MRIEANSFKIALAAAVGFVGFVVSLVAFAGLFGGGWEGYLLAIAVFAVVFMIVYLFQRILVRPVAGTPTEESEESEILQDTVSIAPPEPDEEIPEDEQVCDPGPHEIDGGGMLWLELDIEKGDRINGHLDEASGQDFDWFIVDEENLVLARKREEFNYERGSEGVSADTVRWAPRRNGPWFLLVDLYRRSNPREVEVLLRRS